MNEGERVIFSRFCAEVFFESPHRNETMHLFKI